jgi:hypothetical protein
MSMYSSQSGSFLRTTTGAALLCGLRLLLPCQGS